MLTPKEEKIPMALWAKYSGGVEVSDRVLQILASFAPTGTPDMLTGPMCGRVYLGY
jgi:hypothetical protein